MKTRWILTLALVLAMLLPGASLAEPMTYNLSPSLDGDDTEEIQAVFTEAAANPGSTIVFAAGDYYLSGAVVVTDLSGAIRGAGSQATVLHRNLAVPFELVDVPGAGNGGTDATTASMFLLLYSQDGLQLSWEGMGWDVDGKVDDYPHAWYGQPCAGLYPLWIEGLYEAKDLDTTWRDIRMTGEEMPGYGTEVNLYAHMLRNMAGTHVITDSHYDTIDYGPAFFMANGATVRIGGKRPQDQVTARNTWVGVMLGQAWYSHIEIDNLRVWREDTPRLTAGPAVLLQASNANELRVTGLESNNQGGVGVTIPWWTTEPSRVLVEHSTIVTDPIGWWAGIEIWDNVPGLSEFVIRNNHITAVDPDWARPIIIGGSHGAVIANNVLTGRGDYAIMLGDPGLNEWYTDTDALLQANNVQRWELVDSVAPIWLGPYTSSNTVVGGDKDLVVDETDDPLTEGYDGANILNGVNATHGILGGTVSEAMQKVREMKDLFK